MACPPDLGLAHDDDDTCGVSSLEGAAKICKVLNCLEALSFTVMHGAWYGSSEAGWNITSVIMVLMVRPKLSLAVENLFTSSCIFCSVVASRAQSPA